MLQTPENFEQATRNMDYIRFVTNDDVNKMITFLSLEEFGKIRAELKLYRMTLRKYNRKQLEMAYVSAYRRLAEENKFMAIIKIRKVLRKDENEKNEIVKKVNEVMNTIKNKFINE